MKQMQGGQTFKSMSIRKLRATARKRCIKAAGSKAQLRKRLRSAKRSVVATRRRCSKLRGGASEEQIRTAVYVYAPASANLQGLLRDVDPSLYKVATEDESYIMYDDYDQPTMTQQYFQQFLLSESKMGRFNDAVRSKLQEYKDMQLIDGFDINNYEV
jgi:hypothetical protein